jgi:hypothetical protein
MTKERMPPEQSEKPRLVTGKCILNGKEKPPQKRSNLFQTSFSGSLGAI